MAEFPSGGHRKRNSRKGISTIEPITNIRQIVYAPSASFSIWEARAHNMHAALQH